MRDGGLGLGADYRRVGSKDFLAMSSFREVGENCWRRLGRPEGQILAAVL